MKLTRAFYPALKTRFWAAVLDLAISRLFKISVTTEWYDLEDGLRKYKNAIIGVTIRRLQ